MTHREKGVFVFAFFLLFFPCAAKAEIPFLKTLGATSTAKAVAPATFSRLEKTRDDVLNTYLGSTRDVTIAIGKLAQVLGVSSAARVSLDDMKALTASTFDSQELQQIRQSITAASAALQAQMKSPQKLSPESLKVFSDGVVAVSSSWKELKKLSPKVQSLVQQVQGIIKTAPLQDKMKLQPILAPCLTLLKDLPAQLVAQKDLLKGLKSFVTTNGIPLPQQAQKILEMDF